MKEELVGYRFGDSVPTRKMTPDLSFEISSKRRLLKSLKILSIVWRSQQRLKFEIFGERSDSVNQLYLYIFCQLPMFSVDRIDDTSGFLKLLRNASLHRVCWVGYHIHAEDCRILGSFDGNYSNYFGSHWNSYQNMNKLS